VVRAKKTFLGFSSKPHTFQEKGISEAGQALDILRLDTAERRRYARFIGNLRDEQSLIQTHDESGRRKGFEVGIEKDVHCGTGLCYIFTHHDLGFKMYFGRFIGIRQQHRTLFPNHHHRLLYGTQRGSQHGHPPRRGPLSE
jgi:hypothetical protein